MCVTNRVTRQRAVAAVADDVNSPSSQQQFDDGRARRPHTGDDNPHVLDRLPRHLQRIQQGRQNHYCRAVLVIVKNRNVQFVAQPRLNLKASGRGNILKVDAPVRRGNRLDDRDNLFRILSVEDDRPRIHPTEMLEQHSLPLHDGQCRFRTNIPEAEDGRPIRNHRHRVGFHREQARLGGLVMNGRAHARHARSVNP